MKRFIIKIALPWIVTLFALYWAFKGIDFGELWLHVKNADATYLFIGILLTSFSYILRSARWRLLFPTAPPSLLTSWQVLVLGFFMNNVLPARAGELVRAHLGGKMTGHPRTLVLATIASERLADGLTISAMFAVIIVLVGDGHIDPSLANNLLYVAYIFGGISVGVIAVLSQRERLFRLADILALKLNHSTSTAAVHRLQIFIDGLSPLCSISRASRITAWSLVIWGVELGVFACVSYAFENPLPLSATVVFMVVVNFTSLIPAAPGGFGTIELIAKQVLVSLGVSSPTLALGMVLTQHFIQYAVVGVPGAYLMLSLNRWLREMERESAEERLEQATLTSSVNL